MVKTQIENRIIELASKLPMVETEGLKYSIKNTLKLNLYIYYRSYRIRFEDIHKMTNKVIRAYKIQY